MRSKKDGRAMAAIVPNIWHEISSDEWINSFAWLPKKIERKWFWCVPIQVRHNRHSISPPFISQNPNIRLGRGHQWDEKEYRLNRVQDRLMR